MVSHLDQLRRLRALQRLDQVAPSPLGEQALLASLRADPELNPDLDAVRRSLGYLAEHDLVHLVEVPGVEWRAGQITEIGRLWLQTPEDLGLAIYSPAYQPPEAPDNRHGRVSSVETLPPEVRVWLDQELVRLGFRDYTGLARALANRGWSISRSAVHRYGAGLKAQIAEQTARAKEKAEIARALAGVFGDDAPAIVQGATGAALTAVMDAIAGQEYGTDRETLSSLVRVIPSLGRSFRDAERHKIEQAARRQSLQEAAERVDAAARERGLSTEDARFWRERVLMGM
jgi:hypothetical protein